MFETLQALFKSPEPKISVIDKVWMSAEAKFKACSAMATLNKTCVFIAWFEDTYKTLATLVGEERAVLAQHVDSHVLIK
jgi:hypothetical protein